MDVESSFERINVRDSIFKGMEWFPPYVRMTDSWLLFLYSPLHQTCPNDGQGWNRKCNKEHAAACCSSGQGSGAMAVSTVAPAAPCGVPRTHCGPLAFRQMPVKVPFPQTPNPEAHQPPKQSTGQDLAAPSSDLWSTVKIQCFQWEISFY